MIFASLVRISRSEAGSPVSTKTHPDDPPASLPPSVVILGNDAQLAARPATPVQLAHACLSAGYRAVVPVSWGDELIAAATMQALASQSARPAIHCACPHVARRVLAVGSDLSPYLVSLVSPPVAAARYVRRHSPAGVRVTYVGRCPGAGDDSIDARLTPEELLAQLAERGIRVSEQPLVFESVIPPDRRRHRSQPGGLPSPDALWSDERPTTVEVISEDDLVSEIAEKVLAATNSLLDLAPSVGCVCAGAVAGALPDRARADVVALEPPRASAPVVDESFAAGLELPLPVTARSPLDLIIPAERGAAAAREAESERASIASLPAPPEMPLPETTPQRRPRFTPPESEAPAAVTPRRRPNSPSGRTVTGSMPVSSDSEGRVLPRAYVARRRSPRGGIPVVPDPPRDAVPQPVVPSLPAPPAREPEHASADAQSVASPRVEPSPSARVDARVEPPTTANGESGTPRHTARVAPAPRGEATTEMSRGEHHQVVQRGPPPVVVFQGGALLAEQPVHSVVAPVAGVVHAPAPAVLDAELPIVQSVEPPHGTNGRRARVVVPAIPVLVEQVRRTSMRVSGGVRAVALRSPRVALIVAVATFILLGVAIGYAAAHRSPGRATDEAGGQIDDQRFPAATPVGADSQRTGGARRDTAARRAAPVPARRPGASVRRQQRGAEAVVAPPIRPPEETTAPPTATPDAVATARDSVARAAAAIVQARADSLTAEREALRRELEDRRARLDSIARRVQELKPRGR
jgi:hypothetical protein